MAYIKLSLFTFQFCCSNVRVKEFCVPLILIVAGMVATLAMTLPAVEATDVNRNEIVDERSSISKNNLNASNLLS